MKVYVFDAKGVWLKADIVVIAGNKPAARRRAVEWLKKNDLNPATLGLQSEHPVTIPGIVHAYDGNY